MKRKSYSFYLLEERNRRVITEQDLNLRLKQQEAITEIGEFALNCDDLGELFDKAAYTVAATLAMEYCKILELQPDGKTLLLRGGVGWKPGMVGHATEGTALNSQAGYALLSLEPVIVEDFRSETRFSYPLLLKEHGVISGMSTVIAGEEGPWGVLGVHSDHQHKFYPHDTRFIMAIANIIASSIRRIAVEERLRNSRDELSVILQGVSEGITVQDPRGNVIYANHAAAKLMGYENTGELLAADLPDIMRKFVMLDQQGNPFPVEQLPGRQVLAGAAKASEIIRFRMTETSQEHWSIVDAAPIYDTAGQVIQAINIFRDVTDLIISEQNSKFLVQAGTILASSLDYKTTLANISQLAVTNLADWCSVHLVDEQHEVVRLAVAHKERAKTELAEAYQQKYPPRLDADNGISKVLKTGETDYYPYIADWMLEAAAVNEEHFEMIRALGMKSAIIAPLKAHGVTFGAMTFIWAETDRRYTERDVELANELARRASLAVENARLYEEVRQTNAELEKRVTQRTAQLERSNRVLLQEIEERRKAEEALQKSEVMLNSLFESAPDGILLVNLEGKIARVNRQAEVIFQRPREKLLGMKVEDLVPAISRGQHSGKRAKYIKSMSTRTMGAGLPLYAVREDGAEFPVDIMLSPFKTEESDLVICAIRDITEQKRLQAELEETHRRLFDSIEDERLLISQEIHDGPIQDLIALTYYLNSLRSVVRTAEDLDELRDASQNARNIIQNLRELCGNLRPPTLSNFGLEKSIRSHLSSVQKTHPDLNIRARLMSDGGALPERTRLALFRIYQNSISNSLRHAQAKTINVDFRIENGVVKLSIQDDGQGFQMPKRWVNLAREGHYGLVGMRERVEALGGTLTIQSGKGKGTVVQVKVPVKKEPASV